MLPFQQSFSLSTTRVFYKLIQNGGTVPEGASFQVNPYAPIVTYCVGTVTRLQLALLCPSPGGRSASDEMASVKAEQKAPEFFHKGLFLLGFLYTEIFQSTLFRAFMILGG